MPTSALGSPTQPDSGSDASPAAPPGRVRGVAGLSVGVALAVGAFSGLVLRSLDGALGERRPGWVAALLVLLGVAAFLPLWPAVASVAMARRAQAAWRRGDVVLARRTAAAGRVSALTALGYAFAALLVAGGITFAATNDAAVARTFLRPDLISESWRQVSAAFWVNVKVAVGAEVLVLVVGLAVAIMRMSPGPAGRPLRFLAVVYVDTFRAIPGIIVLYLVGFGLSLAQVPIIKDFSATWLAILALTITYGAYVAEVYRAGIDSIHPSQWAAARSLGLSYAMTLRTVIIPQAFRRIIPPLLNDFIGLQKDTALIGVMGVVDAFLQARLISSRVFNLSPVIVVAMVFVVATIPQARLVDRLVARDQARQRAGGA
jgi:polar amino acid transport system permease protein